MTKEEQIIDSYRLLVQQLLVCPSRPCLHEGTDLALSDFIASDIGSNPISDNPWELEASLTLQRYSVLSRLGGLNSDQIKSYSEINGGLDAIEQEYLEFIMPREEFFGLKITRK
jgi:hypothetical protein